MSLLVPPAVNYPDMWTSNPSLLNRKPVEGERFANFEIDWATAGGVNNAVAINMQNQSTQTFSQICSLAVDNSDCGMDIRFLFPDTGFTVTVPAGALNLIIPVFTNQVQFIVAGTINNEQEEPKDVTRFAVLNFVPPPIAVPPTTAQELGALLVGNVDGSTLITLIAAGSVYAIGTIEGITANYAGQAIAGGVVTFILKDGTGKLLATFQMAAANATVYNVEMLRLLPCSIRYSGGLFLQQTGTNIGGQVTLNIPVKLP